MSFASKKIQLTLPEIAFIGMTRGLLGLGIGLLLSAPLGRNNARVVGIALAAVGVLTSVPIALRLRGEFE